MSKSTGDREYHRVEVTIHNNLSMHSIRTSSPITEKKAMRVCVYPDRIPIAAFNNYRDAQEFYHHLQQIIEGEVLS